MPYTERMAEAFLQAQGQQGQQEPQPQEPQGVPVQGTAPGVQGQVNWPKYRKPTEEERKQTAADIKAAGMGVAGTLGSVLSPLGSAAFLTGTGVALEHFSPAIEHWVGNQESIPDHDKWTENDYWNAYHGI